MSRRATQHNGRANGGKVYNPKHNDRNFSEDRATDRNAEMEKHNVYWNRYDNHLTRGKDVAQMSFEEAEARFYDETFGAWLSARNDRQIENRHRDRVMTMDEVRANSRYCPEETILQLGDKHYLTKGQTLWDVFNEQIQWERKTFPNRKVIDFAIHFDETTPHLHERVVWVGHDKNGNIMPSQRDALLEMGIERPEPDKPRSQFNNEKMTFSAVCRQHFLEVCKAHGLTMDKQPKEPSKSGLSLLKYKTQQESAKLAALQEQIQQKQAELDRLDERIQTARKQNSIVDMVLHPIRTSSVELDGPSGRD